MVDDRSVFQRSPDVIACSLGDGAALLDTRTSTYFTMNDVGSGIWETLAEPASVSEIVKSIVDKFDVSKVSAGTIAVDVRAMLEELAGAELVTVVPQ